MPHKTSGSSPAVSKSIGPKAERARRFLKGGGVTREDSDDELGLEDIPWEWIYERTDNTGGVTSGDDSSIDELSTGSPMDAPQKSRKRKSLHNSSSLKRKIVGAKMGSFTCLIGDTVLLKAEGINEAWVGLICEFMQDDEGEKMAYFMWFSTEKEIRNKEKKRKDFLQNELYISPSWDFNPLISINGKANVVSEETFRKRHPSGRIPRNSQDYGKLFICRRGCNTRTATYTEEFVWEDVHHETEEDIIDLGQKIESETKATRKRRTIKQTDLKDDNKDVDFKDDKLPDTPRKRNKTPSKPSPNKLRTPSKTSTPANKKIILKKPLEFTPLGTRIISPGHIQSPFQIARTKLHVSSVPAALPCREAEFGEVNLHLEAAISDGSGACIYISGTPGTGKTATVREVVSQLNASVMADELDDFIFVEINGMKVTDPHQSYSLLWEALKGERVSPAHALELLEYDFNNPSPRRVPCVVLMDELDQLVTKNQSVMYNFFNWPGLRHSRLIVLAVANTMDLPERTLSNKISSRLGLTRITFPGYNHDQLKKIIQSRLEGVPGGIVEPDAIEFASRKVAAVSGDARRALDICRRAVELAEAECESDESWPPTPSKLGKDKLAGDQHRAKSRKVTIATVKRAINEATSSPLQQYLRALPLSFKLLLAALLVRVRRSGLAECILGDVLDEAKRMAKMTISNDALEHLLAETSESKSATLQRSKDHPKSQPRIISMGAASFDLAEAGIIGLESRKGDRTGKIRLIIGDEDIRLAFKDDPDMKDIGFQV